MSFLLPELIIESVIRDGIAGLVNDPAVIDNVFASLTEPYNSRKYGQKEINKIKDLILKKQIPVVHNLSDVSAKVPCYSIQIGLDAEDKGHALLEDFSADFEELTTDPKELAALVVLSGITIISYNNNSGRIIVDSGTDLSQIHKNLLFVDIAGTEFVIKNVIKQGANKGFFIPKGSTPSIAGLGIIKSSIDFKQFEERTVTSDEQIMVGVHAKDALTTKYLYVLLKYFMVSRKKDLIRRCFQVSSFSGSDFSRNLQYLGDHVYTRFLTVTGKIEDTWKAEEVIPIDQIEVQVLVPKDEAPASDIGNEDSSVKPTDRDDFDC